VTKPQDEQPASTSRADSKKAADAKA